MMEKKEEWRDISGYEGRYQVSNLGKVKSLPKYRSKKERILKGDTDKDGYLSVTLCPDPKTRKRFRVHRLVAASFIYNLDDLPEVDHINAIRDDNRAENLRWASRRSNQLNCITREKLSESRIGYFHSEETKRKMSEARKGKRLSETAKAKVASFNSSPVVMIGMDGLYISVFSSIKEAGETTGISPKRISDVCLNKRNKAGGYVWRKI